MSNYPPPSSFAGQNYTPPQWPSSSTPSTSIPSSLPHHHFVCPQNHHIIPASHDGAALPGDYNQGSHMANAHLPGLGGPSASGQLPPPPFGFMAPFTPSQFPPPPFPPMPLPPLRYPSIQAPSAPGLVHPTGYHLNEPQTRLAQEGPTPAGSQLASTTSSNPNPDREEGELTDGDDPPSQSRQSEPAPVPSSGDSNDVPEHLKGNGKVRSMRDRLSNFSGAAHPKTSVPSVPFSSSQVAGKGGSNVTSTEGSLEDHSSSRSSGSPYNPALTMPAESPLSNSPGETTTNDATVTHLDRMSNWKPATQLRLQAKGALLSLAPHNIRYNELVGEGIDPCVLRQLYEEVGIKIPTPQPDVDSTPPSSSISSKVGNDAEHESAQEMGDSMVSQNKAAAQQDLGEAVTPPTAAPQAVTGKPMERKEVIARMLAAKKAKTSTPVPLQTEAAKEIAAAPGSGVPEAGETMTLPSREAPAKEKEARVKEKNKAQTELARQRIEQLKKQGLMRSLQKPQSDPTPSEPIDQNSSSSQETPQPTNLPPIQHPLPERPPDPEPSPQSRIPGLFMTEEQEPDATEDMDATPVEHAMDTDTQPRVNQRKRPRASDFDEPIPMPKKSYSNGANYAVAEPARLVIDISDDEFYGDDEIDSMEVDFLVGNVSQDGEAILRSTPTMALDTLPQRPATSLSQGFSTSVTPNGRNYDQEHQEHLRRKDLEIKAMHRRIAELEERKKAKLAASRTQSPRAVDGPVPPANPMTADVATPDHEVLELAEASSQPIDTTSPLPKDPHQLEMMRAKILRKQEIESGIPALDHQIDKSEARLVEVKQEENALVAEIAKGKEGRQQLLHELQALSQELQGVTLGDIELALRQTQNEDIAGPNSHATTHELPPRPNTEQIADAPNPQPPVQDEIGPAIDSALHAKAPIPNSELEKDTIMDDVHEEQMATSSSDSMSSSMDESSDSDSESDDPASVESEASVSQSPAPATVEPEVLDEQTGEIEQEKPVDLDSNNPSLELSQLTNPESQVNTASDEHMDESAPELLERGSRESSVSDAYEPPEPEMTASPAGSTYSPPFSPASPGPVEPTDDSESPSNEAIKASEPLTETDQGLGVYQPRNLARISPLDNERHSVESRTTFTQYESPLKQFKAYRYHPSYVDNVANGYRSLTYSHNIDPMKYLCPFEVAGGICNDRSCEFQHFRDMSLSDDKILVQMGSLREGKTPEEKDEYIAGLKQIINDMRRDKVKDFSTVAAEIAAYRRRFLQDPSRILPL
ncbi:uncharacterized protein BO97DRAFT_428247 [Aspergillus homomorphus CBS 101889]|nr:hypothetical protein BO97DRAFT_428247 [Aspergillus homomorphus CBS 101889]RAL08600.1 hypothetical protein BO97DRAFT_428247 [Aspergillus homomorphus CBS 101889]